ncbi:cation:proton antiporter [Spirosoma utsteinense]|uniref:CPA1 family monovalent cation:H+ antiporter n=1 Tax=Spirosoma utsteinense TaxID=2585773 RepID=A0ABR6WBU9_9BACT|nr:sodium:proton antiporter [Spirosoma utsteinense]MBC3786975.1 CPA1 family monovalent cation:H+ antiporter [Spirosoma utsteinense]MBC3794043.1 CPA1 family monovalent cation:H+ antiporter [Spirosoma utsteinense]
MEILNLLSLLIVIAAAFSYINVRFLKLPDSIGIMMVSVVFSVLLLFINMFRPEWFMVVKQTVQQLDFYAILFNVMLSFLLFAGAYHTDAAKLRIERRSVILFSLVGVTISTFLVGTGLYYVAGWVGYSLGYPLCLLFGALISPTDPIAVLGILAKFQLPESVKLNIVGESLFNDGVGVVVFATIYQIVLNGVDSITPGEIVWLFLQEAVGGLFLGVVIGFIMYRLMRSVDHYQVEVLITLAGVMGGYALAHYLHVSGPLAMVVAGLFVGAPSRQDAMSAITEEYVHKFWELIDVILNAVLFVLIGVELLIIDLEPTYTLICLLAIGIVLFSRYVSIIIPYRLTRKWLTLDDKAPLMLTWGGLRGGISIALALSIDSSVPYKDLIVTITYAVVLASVMGQGLTMERLIRRLYPPDQTREAEGIR